jgi:hypothetical protein
MNISDFWVLIHDYYNEYLSNLENAPKILPDEPYTEEWNKSGVEIGQFIHSNIYNDIIKNMKVSFKFSWIFNGIKLNLEILYKTFEVQRTRHLFFMLNLIVFILNKKRNFNHEINILLIHSTKEKKKPNRTSFEEFTCENVNSGYTMNGKFIVVYRREEMVKVLIHELIHAFNFNQKDIYAHEELRLNSYFHLSGRSININESFTDTFACLLNIALYSLFQSNNVWNLYLLNCHKNFTKEQKYITQMSRNILDYYKYDIALSGISRENKENIHESTHVISYYVLKSIMFNNVELFLEYLYQHDFFLSDPKGYEDIIFQSIPVFCEKAKRLKSKVENFISLRMSSLDILKLLKDNKD